MFTRIVSTKEHHTFRALSVFIFVFLKPICLRQFAFLHFCFLLFWRRAEPSYAIVNPESGPDFLHLKTTVKVSRKSKGDFAEI